MSKRKSVQEIRFFQRVKKVLNLSEKWIIKNMEKSIRSAFISRHKGYANVPNHIKRIFIIHRNFFWVFIVGGELIRPIWTLT